MIANHKHRIPHLLRRRNLATSVVERLVILPRMWLDSDSLTRNPARHPNAGAFVNLPNLGT